jgi:catechol 2,3-dioxygenase-like lactoylglutathione lyase family enzyme
MSEARVNVKGLAYLSMYVEDLSASRRFYAELLGLDVAEEGDWGIVVRTGDVGVFLHTRSGQPMQHIELTFDVDDADAAVEALRGQDVPVVDEPSDRAWGDRDGAVTDPDGNVIYLRSAKGS